MRNLYSIQQLQIGAQKAKWRLLWRWIAIPLSVLAYFGIARYGIGLGDEAAMQELQHQYGVESWILFLVITLLVISVALCGFWQITRTFIRRPAYRCPYCHQSFEDRLQIVIATRNCGHCGRRVLSD